MGSLVAHIAKGAVVEAGGRRFCVRGFVDADRVKALDLDSYRERELALSEIVEASKVTSGKPDFTDIPERQWREAVRRFRVIEPLLGLERRSAAHVEAAAKKADVCMSTVYRWMDRFEADGVVTSLVRRPRADRGETRVQPEVEALIGEVIADFYLTPQKRKVTQIHRELVRRCRKAGLAAPHINTLHQRIRAIRPEKTKRRRHGTDAALKHRPLRGKFPGADFPYAVLQIDHTQVDVILVDEEHRIPIGRPWITVAIDVFSRMVAGYYVSFDPPGALGTGLCIARAILPKRSDLETLELDVEWPCQGIPAVIHADNAKEFRGRMLENACIEYGISLQFRPVRRPRYGGHIERLLGSLLSEIHALPGSTFSSPADRGNYDSEKHAALTLSEFERWLANLVGGRYHNDFHTEIGTTPLRRYREGILGDGARPGIGALPVVRDPERLRLDFLPYLRRTVQPYGVMVDNIVYYADVLQRWIGAADPENLRRKRRFVFRRDPRDVSFLWFYDPDAREYFRVPYRDTSLPPMSLWELRAVRRRLEQEGRAHVDEEAIFEAYDEMRRIEEASKGKTAALARERRRRHRRAARDARRARAAPEAPAPAEEPVEPEAPPEIRPFDEVERF